MAYTLTSKARVTLPKTIREHLRMAPGDAVHFRIVADGSLRVEPASAADAGQAKQLAATRARFGKLKGSGGHSRQAGTDALMRLLRGHDEDATDPGFSDVRPAAMPTAARTTRAGPTGRQGNWRCGACAARCTPPDLLIGAHAAVHGWPLLTRDRRRYDAYFNGLEIVTPD